MNLLHRKRLLTAAVTGITVAGMTTAASADLLFWQGGTDVFDVPNYFNNDTDTPNVPPTPQNFVNIGVGGTINVTEATVIDLMRVGNGTIPATGYAGGDLTGDGTLNITDGGSLTVADDEGTAVLFGGSLNIGEHAHGIVNVNNGTLSVDGATLIGVANLGDDNTPDVGSGTLNLSGTSSYVQNGGRLALGDGLTGTVNVSDNASLTFATTGGGQDLIIGEQVTGTFNQTGGTVEAGNVVFVGHGEGAGIPNGSSLTVSGGTFTAGTDILAGTGDATNTSVNVDGGTVNVPFWTRVGLGDSSNTSVNVTDGTLAMGVRLVLGEANASNTSLNVSGGLVDVGEHAFIGTGTTSGTSASVSGGTVDVSASTHVGTGRATGSSLEVSEGGTLSTGDHAFVGIDSATNTTLTVSGGTLNAGIHFFLGQGASNNTTFNLSGGTVNVGDLFLMGSGGAATGVVTNHSGGTLNVRTGGGLGNFVVADAGDPVATYNLSGDGVINANGTMGIIGRQGTGSMYQSGGIANFAGPLDIANAQGTGANPTGLYEISGGTLNAGGLSVGVSGDGTFTVIGGDGVISIDGDVNVFNGDSTDAGTLEFVLEDGEGVSQIFATGDVTFAAGSELVIDLGNVDLGAMQIDLLTASNIIDEGLVLSAPSGITLDIISGGNGQILRATLVPEPMSLGLLGLGGLALLRKRRA